MKQHAPATLRNREPLAEVLGAELPETGLVLEVASGTGEHAAYFARRFPALVWQPSDPDAQSLVSIRAWREEEGLANLLVPLALDASSGHWPVEQADAILCVNMVHISPWEATCGLFAGTARMLSRGAPLILYGPYLETDVETAPSNLTFDESLKARNPQWGLRDLAALDRLGDETGFDRTRRVEMPANNLTLVYRRK